MICDRKKSKIASDNTIQEESLGNFFIICEDYLLKLEKN